MSAGLQKAFAAAQGVFIGQIWQDWDIRFRENPRLLKVLAFRISKGGILMSDCMVVGSGKMVKIAVKRMKPTSTGYKLVKDVSEKS